MRSCSYIYTTRLNIEYMLYEVIVRSKINTFRSRIIDTNLIEIKNSILREFKYQYTHPILPPSLININGKT